MPRPGTAADRLASAIDRLGQNPMPAALLPPASWMFERLASEMSFQYRVLFANRWLFEPLLLSQLARAPGPNALIRTTAALTVLSAGAKENVIPASARARVNFRMLPGQTIEQVSAHVRDKIGDTKIEVRVMGDAWEASRVSRAESFGYALIEQTIRQVYGEVAAAPTLTIAATDSRHYIDIAEDHYYFIPMRLQSSDLKRIHGIDERIAISDYIRMVQFYAALIRNSGGNLGQPSVTKTETR